MGGFSNPTLINVDYRACTVLNDVSGKPIPLEFADSVNMGERRTGNMRIQFTRQDLGLSPQSDYLKDRLLLETGFSFGRVWCTAEGMEARFTIWIDHTKLDSSGRSNSGVIASSYFAPAAAGLPGQAHTHHTAHYYPGTAVLFNAPDDQITLEVRANNNRNDLGSTLVERIDAATSEFFTKIYTF